MISLVAKVLDQLELLKVAGLLKAIHLLVDREKDGRIGYEGPQIVLIKDTVGNKFEWNAQILGTGQRCI